MPMPGYFHLHLVSDSTGETLTAAARAVVSQFRQVQALEHIHAMVRTPAQIERVIKSIEEHPGIVLFTLVNTDLTARLETACLKLSSPCLSLLAPVMNVFQSYLGLEMGSFRPGAQHALDAEYFRRIDAMNFTMLHDDGQHTDTLYQADVILLGISRTSKTPTSVYLANKGIKTANVPLVLNLPPPQQLDKINGPLVIGLVASTERIVQIRQNRLLSLKADNTHDSYVDHEKVNREIIFSRRYCAERGWPVLDVTRKSIEETASAIIRMLNEKQEKNPEN